MKFLTISYIIPLIISYYKPDTRIIYENVHTLNDYPYHVMRYPTNLLREENPPKKYPGAYNYNYTLN
jgi:hypothetical protein